jgi:hypothetical protein
LSGWRWIEIEILRPASDASKMSFDRWMKNYADTLATYRNLIAS